MYTGEMRHRLFKAGAAILAFIATLPAAVTPAYAHASTHNAVIFGDSVVANPELIRYVATWLKIPTTTPPTERGECPTSPHNFGVLAAQRLGLRADNYACAGAVGVGDKSLLSASRRSVSLQIDQAAAQRTLNRNTKRVFISLGFNDTYSQLARGRTDHQIRHDFAAKMTREVARIRKLAPHARIQFIGYPRITENNSVCLFHVGNNLHDYTFAPEVAHLERLAQEMEQDAAAASGAEFVNLKGATKNNHMCAPDNQRMWSGIIDGTAGHTNLPFHLNDRGHKYVADFLAK
ncbi:Secreted hydrolase [Corynebacterium pseudotuberculosis]|nr:Secreted hydrolase [Corynebacterium pseudotuberculosis PAT10]AEP69794.1 Secreted hydrolase [Corynebacterium pseudotuberculosis 42/02-A]AFF21690.1 Hydrolase domain-containing protein [Corynebacterium pseudotuberculosis P54B96]AKC73289.1 Hydrolase domain-containing protein [Corynebacterium pseudotuberculosis]AKJ55207.1 Secreted hydrolase [Corynebacterium pseudotuberculosis]